MNPCLQKQRVRFFGELQRVYKESLSIYLKKITSFERFVDAVLTVEKAFKDLKLPPHPEELKEDNKPEAEDSSCEVKFKNGPSWGWSRTGLEPEVVLYVNDQPLDAILDLGSNVSLMI